MRLHHRMGVIGRGVGRVELNRCRGERAGEIADRGIGRTAGDARGLAGILDRCEIERALSLHVIDPDQLRGGAGLLEGLRHHERDRLVIMLDLGTAEQRGEVEVALGELAGIVSRDDGEHAGCCFGGRQIHRGDPALGNR